MRVKFLFISAINPSQEVEIRYAPLGIGYLVSSLRNHFGEDAIQFKVIDSNIEQEVINFKPDIVGISSVSQNYNKAISYARIVKKYGIPVICGGVHISMIPSSLTKDMDVGVIGEGEETICDLLELFIRGKKIMRDDLRNVKGIVYWDNEENIAFTEKRSLINSLDSLPLPARDLFDIPSNTYMFTSRGCPYRCAFCASSRFWNKVRFFSAEYVVNEIQHLVNKYNVKGIHFYDDLFSINLNRTKEIIHLLKTKKILGTVKFYGSIRANLVNDETISLLKEMGVESLSMGLESGCNDSLKFLKGDSIDVTKNEDAIKIIREHDIGVHCSFIIGSPTETRENILETLNFIKRNRLPSYMIYVLTPFPGTPIWDYAKSRGLVDDNMDWDKLNVNFGHNYGSAIIMSERLSRKEIYNLFLKFKKHQEQKRFIYLFRECLKNPFRIPDLMMKKT